LRTPVQQHLLQQEIPKTGLSLQASSSFTSDMLKFATLVKQRTTAQSEAVSEKDKIMVITNWYLI
jgi:hypothetical protein